MTAVYSLLTETVEDRDGLFFCELCIRLHLKMKPMKLDYMCKTLSMNKILLVLSIISFVITQSQAQTNPWRVADESDIVNRSNAERFTKPSVFSLYELDVDLLRDELKACPHEDQISARHSYAQFQFPLPNGEFRTFNLVEYDMMEPLLARKYPTIGTYIGVDPEHGGKIHLNLTSNQFFATINERGTTYYIDPYFRTGADPYYVSYNIKDYNRKDFSFSCNQHEIIDNELVEKEELNNSFNNSDQIFRGYRGDALTLRSYRLAVSASFEFTDYHGGAVSDAIDAIVTIVNRINSVYERDAAVRFVLVNNNDQIVFTTADDDPFEDGNLGQMINQNQTTINSIIGVNNYDIGHVFGRAFYQGLAGLGNVCSGGKARGGSVSNPPLGDSYVVNIVCHEMGHQFSANHTMYHCHNVNMSTSYEPGSGTTIMSYAGICGGGANVQANADDYFHANSLEAIIGFSRNGNGAGCGEETDFGNTYPDPIIELPSNLRIPVNTPFRLTGSATDSEDSTTLTYSWDQYQNGIREFATNPWDINVPIGNEPLFRSLPPSPSPTRYFPSLSRVVNGVNYIWEQLPSYARELKFRFIVRDNAAENGGTSWRTFNLEVVDNSAAGTFAITNFNFPDTIDSGGYVELTWNVAETDLPPINTKLVDIYLSTDGGSSFPTLLKSNVANDGSTFVNIPDIPTNRFRFMLAASENVYYDVNNRSGVIRPAEQEGIGLSYDDQYYQVCAPDIVEFDVTAFGLAGYNGNVQLAYIGDIPQGGDIDFASNSIMPGESTKLRLDFREVTENGNFDLTFRATGTDVDTVERTIEIFIVTNNFDELSLNAPADGSTGNAFVPSLAWNSVSSAENYTVEVSSDAEFSNIIFSRNNVQTDNLDLDIQLEAGGIYFWRVKPNNACGLQDINRVSAFQVQTLSCEEYCSTQPSITLASSGTPTAEMSINTGSAITVNDLNVTQIVGRHSDMGQVVFTLVGPNDTQVEMMSPGTCSYVNSNIDMGFDDDAAITNPNCINFDEGIRFVPDNPLSALNGLSGTDYKLVMQDVQSGAGGRLDSWCFEICGAISPEKPELIRADDLSLMNFETKFISQNVLEVTHSQYTDDDLLITIVEIPEHGKMLFEGSEIGAGYQFNMQDIRDNKLQYQNQSNLYDQDHFSFIVSDPGGGFLGTPTINFIIGLTATEEAMNSEQDLIVFPNPASEEITIELQSNVDVIEMVQIFSITGQQVMLIDDVSVTDLSIRLDKTPPGIYLVHVKTEQSQIIKKILKQ